ncbi:phosphopyruvate hydratase [Candidatus Woesebacteria bacterium RIFCSPHIGHO2_01_FULL_39_32]|uniref:Enolase n=2 Tax=Candidatus Woeseibacteriota TaxID=1752722 RepID=A0A1F8BMC3_9BACT|nr:MAG: phosphopyruvate hydratase [Candidatus Woesebacteria bacterium RIFCSPHIGHO2_01_FULL_39_32]OGM65100.1 MAG: phosphopyruvate hydratase [Candidatus Woesebacteria bacterium RIFCSPLOWO2_01_FULL_39_25]
MSSKISKVWARQILDSRGIPTVEAACQLDTGEISVASVPSGTSTGTHEALELRDNDPQNYLGKSVYKAVSNVNEILGPGVWGLDVEDQEKVDKRLIELDGTENKSKYGANAILSVSVVSVKAASLATRQPLYLWINTLAKRVGIKEEVKVPTPVFVMIEGGLHGAGNLDFQEFHIIPASSKKYSESLKIGVEIFLVLGTDLERRGAIHSFGQEGGYAPNLFTNADALEVLYDSIKQTSYQVGRDVFFGLDVAPSVFYKGGEYTIRDKSAPLSDDALLEYYKYVNSQYHLALLEDPFHEDAWDSWKKIFAEMSDQLTIVGDDLLTTNAQRLEKAVSEKACNGILVKPNQAGTVTETLKVIKMARDANWKINTSHRGGETNDWFIADFACGIGSDYAKFGAPSRGERVVKYNRLLSIEAELLQKKQ